MNSNFFQNMAPNAQRSFLITLGSDRLPSFFTCSPSSRRIFRSARTSFALANFRIANIG